VSTANASDLCRVVVATSHGSAEMALPASVPICDLLPVLAAQAVTSRPGTGGPGEAPRRAVAEMRRSIGDEPWVLQRLGQAPLDGDLTLDALGVRDGETLHLRPAGRQLPAADFDDLIDGLATGMNRRADNWADHMTRWLYLGVAGLASVLGLLLLFQEGPTVGRAALAGGAAMALLTLGTICSRAFGQAASALLFGAAAVPYAGLAGLLLPGLPGVDGGQLWTAPAVLIATSAATLAALLGLALIGTSRLAFLASLLASLAGQAGALLVVLAGVDAAPAAAIVAASALALSPMIPTVSFRMARLRLPELPTGAADLSADIEPYPIDDVLAGAARLDGFVTALLGAVGAICAVALILLADAEGGAATWLVVAISGALLIRCRGLRSAWQRLANIVPALLGLALLTVHMAAAAEWPVRAGLAAGLLGAAGVAAGLAQVMPGRRLLPHWARVADIAEYAAAIAVLPLTLAVLGVFGWARALAG
jgi:type VII secretion integral membrane protein EccD